MSTGLNPPIRPTFHEHAEEIPIEEWLSMGRLLGVPVTYQDIWKSWPWNQMLIQLGMEPVAELGATIPSTLWNEMVQRLYTA